MTYEACATNVLDQLSDFTLISAFEHLPQEYRLLRLQLEWITKQSVGNEGWKWKDWRARKDEGFRNNKGS